MHYAFSGWIGEGDGGDGTTTTSTPHTNCCRVSDGSSNRVVLSESLLQDWIGAMARKKNFKEYDESATYNHVWRQFTYICGARMNGFACMVSHACMQSVTILMRCV